MDPFQNSDLQRRKFLEWIGLSGLALAFPAISLSGCQSSRFHEDEKQEFKNVFDLEGLSEKVMGKDAIDYLNGGADDSKTVKANVVAYQKIQIRARRLIDVSTISTKVELFGQTYETPIILSPVGFQKFFHQDGEVATAKASVKKQHQMIVSSVSNYSVNEIAAQSQADLWFQLYPTTNREVTKKLLERAEKAGCKVCVLTVDTPVIGNRERGGTTLTKLIYSKELKMGNYEGILTEGTGIDDPGLTWEIISWLRANCDMKIVLKGIVTREDATLALEYGVDGIIVSNHGGRQLESLRSTIECLPEIVEEIKGRIPVLIDGGIRRGTDIFKALAIGANAVCIGRPFCWGLGALGQEGVEIALDILKAELIRDMQLAGTPSIEKITCDFVIGF
ncbi:alpha-hydroxy acid oxidase [Aquiflexum gelatinilyticum]|uniref:Alpha-hydroxy-acid oxidizing protein n=1 Tax=Aquiflexum gelatinilyticum TaxID=2961943 RepID=A0A9X2T122_9BACT|nr:alpha-hydroxy acid oxidase [Aquiflexum gelatinilyticum]MCR9015426.1 alpha-hydroxy-acid oxidizing protein [Aquiflexum gelatinilyticum]